MNSDTILCDGCGITLRPFMHRCPRCGTMRPDAQPPLIPDSARTPVAVPAVTSADISTASESAIAAEIPQPKQELRANLPAVQPTAPSQPLPFRSPAETEPASSSYQSSGDSIYMSPPDEVRRFPLFNPSQLVMIGVAILLIALGFIVAWLIWSREKKDASTLTITPNLTAQTTDGGTTLPLPSPTVDLLSASPTPELAPMLEGDQAIYVEVVKALAAYNPIYHSRYQIAVKDGLVTVNGPADNQPEKDGVSNVIKMVAGVRGLTNNLAVKTDPNANMAGLPMNAPATPQTVAPTVTPAPENNLANQQAALEAERQRLAREAEAQRQRETEFQRLRDAEAQQRQRDDELRRQREETERLRAQNTPPANTGNPAPSNARTLRSGSVAWSGVVDGVDEIVIVGSSASVRHRSGEAVREARASFSAPIPRAPVAVSLLNPSGRGAIQIVQEPSAANGYTTIVRIDDSREGGGKPYQFTLRWTAQ